MRLIKNFSGFRVNENNISNSISDKLNNKLDEIDNENWRNTRSLNNKLEGFVFGKHSDESPEGNIFEYRFTFISFNRSINKEWGVTFWTSCTIDGKKQEERSSKNFKELSKFSENDIKELINKTSITLPTIR